MNTRARDRLFWGALTVELLVFVVWQGAHLGGFQWTTDEGLYVMRVRLLQQGYALYRDIWTDQLPGMVHIVRLAFAVGGARVESARAAMVLISAGGLLATALLARRLAGRLGALLVTPLVAITPNYYWLSRAAISPTLPATSLAVMALALVAGYAASKRRGTLLAAGLMMAAALYVKATAILVAGACLVWLWQAAGERRAFWRDVIIWGTATALPLLLALAVEHPVDMWRQFVQTQVVSAGMALKIGPHAAKIGAYLLENWGLTAAALAGLLVCLWGQRWRLAIISSWLGVVIVALLVRSPMWPGHHLSVLLYPLGILAAVAVQALAAAWRARRANWPAALAALGLGAQLVALPGIARTNGALAAAPTYLSTVEAVEFLRERYPQGAKVISDYHMIPFRAGSTVPPSLATVTKKRLQLGLLDADTLANTALAKDVQVILLWDEQLSADAEFVAWARERYALAFKWGYHDILCQPQPGEALFEADVRVGSALTLERYGVRRLAAAPGEAWELVLYWRVHAPLEQQLHGFVHVVDDAGNQIAQHDQLAFGLEHVSTEWQVGELIEDRYEIAVPAAVRPGQYHFSVGLYGADDRQRLPMRLNVSGDELGGQMVLQPRPVVHWPAVMTAPDVDHATALRYGGLAELAGWNAQVTGEAVRVELVWRGLEPLMTPEYVVFAHLRQGGQLAAQADGPPGDGARPTTGWQSGEYIVDTRSIPTAGLAPGDYDLYVGLYDPLTGARAPVRAPDGAPLPGDEALVGQVAVSR
jgi:hypothetical protein